jgi:hypothetical protein
MSNVPSGQVAAFPALTLEMRRALVGLRSKTSLNLFMKERGNDMALRDPTIELTNVLYLQAQAVNI